MSARRRATVLTAAAAAVALSVPAVAAVTAVPATPALQTKLISQDLLSSALRAHPLGAVKGSTPWTLGVTIAGKNDALQDKLFAEQNDKSSPLYHHYLTAGQYKQLFSVDAATTARVKKWLTSTGMRITTTDAEGSYVTVSGTAAQAGKLTHTTLTSYKGLDGKTFVANASAPRVPLSVTSISGMTSLTTAHADVMRTGFPISDSTTPQKLWTFYNQPATITGKGQRLTAFGWGSPSTLASDLSSFETDHELPKVPLTIDQVGDKGTDTSGIDEWDLDSQASTGMAPNVSGMTFYFATSGTVDLIAAAIKKWADDPNGSQQASGSYGLCEAFAELGEFDAHEVALKQASMEGRTFFASTGDNGSGCSAAGAGVNGVTEGPVPTQEYPATSPYSVAVGGTVVYLNADNTRQQEIAWTHGGGGPSIIYKAPTWQDGATLLNTGGMRAEADVSAQSGDLLSGYSVFTGGAESTVGGTSLSAPLWQGMWARVSSSAKTGKLGFAAPLLWKAGEENAESQAFFDVKIGANGLYDALPGYDFPTGWGTPNVRNLIKYETGAIAPAGTQITFPSSPANAPKVTCSPYPQISDAKGDATQVVLVDTHASAASQPDLDILKAGVKWDAKKKAMAFTIGVTNLAYGPKTGENYRFFFGYAGSYEVIASRTATGSTAFSWDSIGTAATAKIADLTGSFSGNTITIDLPASTFTSHIKGVAFSAKNIGSGLSIDAQRTLVEVTATADTAAPATSCNWGLS